MALGAIPFEAVDAYARRFDVGDFDAFYRLIRAMDRTYLEHANRSPDD